LYRIGGKQQANNIIRVSAIAKRELYEESGFNYFVNEFW
jgi:hypothetical protein